MVKKILLAIMGISIIFGFSGCLNNNSITNEHNLRKNGDFINYDNKKHTIGSKDNALKTLTYVEKLNDEVITKITFYIDKFPYKSTFNLCKDMKKNKILSSIKITNNQINCNSYINIDLLKGKLFGKYKIKLLKGFNIKKINKRDIVLKDMQEYEVINANFTEKTRYNDYLNNIKLESFWIIK